MITLGKCVLGALLAVPVLGLAAGPADRPTPAEASRFLAMTTYGPTSTEIEALSQSSFDSWLDTQFSTPPSYHLPIVRLNRRQEQRNARMRAWYENSLHGPDQLRQRVAFALSEIFVVSDRLDTLYYTPEGLSWYYDQLLDGAFGNFRDLLERVTLSPAMGTYLSMLGNAKANPDAGTRADENFARESMQLFTIGLVQLNMDGTPKLVDGIAQATYTQTDIENLARALTGWSFATLNFYTSTPVWTRPMRAFSAYHDSGAKTIVGGVNLPAGQTAQQDLKQALDTLFHHPNTAPFISKQLIQRLVSSNPSPEYVQRVAEVFADNGAGVRGDLKAVWRAILLDPEALNGTTGNADFGKAREPLLALMHLWRTLNARTSNGVYDYPYPESWFGQAPLAAPSVFNFFSPFYAPVGAIRDAGLVAPEFQLTTESSKTTLLNELYVRVFWNWRLGNRPDRGYIQIDIAPLVAVSANPLTLVDQLDTLFLGGQMPDDLRNALLDYLPQVPYVNAANADLNGTQRTLDAIYLTITSPYYIAQH
jgi:uncharacterized protein (DUF1800 family)